ncbi:hypothetical protein HMPREF0576_1775 [Mobiluncus holmesii ATCC 35242]|uniref:Uncharacterized protein n=3 Tax=Mobiluncus TaxID=2050 RepID=D6ZJE3_MOBCV|nr:hypothetical protein HMPREF0573_10523 [Mobiluncus curtisii ATCC 43063]EFU80899.1 hypothetical protein HMPREF0388_0051 [Mobiluncus curtisii ATCC 51333]EFU81262.1 hypothetical protein HMPREF0576_1775 [Mobiluncus holmesii ATCC 35242]
MHKNLKKNARIWNNGQVGAVADKFSYPAFTTDRPARTRR